MKIQSLPTFNAPPRALPALPPAPAALSDQVHISNQPDPGPQPPEKSKFGPIVKGAALGAAALAIPTAIGAAAGPWGAVALGVAGTALAVAKGKSSSWITIDLRLPGALALGGGSFALAMAGNAFGGPAVGLAAAAGAVGMGLLMAR